MKFLILSENTRSDYLYYHYRNPAANELKTRILAAGHDATILEWIRHWDKKDLCDIIDIYFTNESKPVIAISSTFDLTNTDLEYLKDVLAYAKKKIPNLLIMHGGNRTFFPEQDDGLIDIDFLGRSMGIFDDWINNKDISKYKVYEDPIVLTNKNIDVNIDNPLTHQLYEDDFLTKHDNLGFEIGIGCRFNCSFCNYELRNSKTVKLNEVQKLRTLFEEAYNKYGISNFYSIDDTLNESVEKLEILYEAIKDLNYHPKITAWMRADLLHIPKQRELIKKINFDAIYFGIESFNPNVTKTIRKKSNMDHIFDSLLFLKKECPETFTMGSFIIGLTGDNLTSIENGFEKVVNDKLLNSLQLYALTLSPTDTIKDQYNASDIELNPKKYGYKVRKPSWDFNILFTSIIWENDWTNNLEAFHILRNLKEKYKDKILFLMHSECASFRAMNLLKIGQIVDENALKSKALVLANLYKQQYIKAKKKQFLLN